MFYIDWTYIALVLPAVAFAAWASSRVNSTFQTYSRQYIRCGMTGAEAARMILDANRLYQVRTAIVPLTNLGSKLAMPLILIGILFSYTSAYFIQIAYLGVIYFSLCALFQLVTLPTEYNASRRAISTLEGSGRLTNDEIVGAKKVLSAAALTYVATLAVSLTQLLRLLLRVRRNDRRR